MPNLFSNSQTKLGLKPIALSLQILLLTMMTTVGAQAGPESDLLNGRVNQRIKISLNRMVQDVHSAHSQLEKRAVLDQFLAKAENGTALAEKLPFLSTENHAALTMLHEKFDRYAAELRVVPGLGSTQASPANASQASEPSGVARAPAADLDGFATYVQNDLEQASSGGIYLSTGAIIIVLLIILILL